MARMSIGEFAQAAGLTTKALRLYDQLELLTPVEVHPHSGYRFYDESQLERARLVAWLRGLGMPLARIKVVAELPPQAGATEVDSYWRQVEADIAARKQLAQFLIDHLSRKDSEMATTPTPLRLHSAAHTDVGLVRHTNEDAVYAGGQLFAVADGFGMQDADSHAATAALAALKSSDIDTPSATLVQRLRTAAGNAHTAVTEFRNSASSRDEVGSTLTALLFSGAHIALAHVGDSRAYLLRDGELHQLTHDHTYV